MLGLANATVLSRYGAKHALGTHLVSYLSNYQRMYEAGLLEIECGDAVYRAATSTMDSETAETVESVLHPPSSTSGSGKSPGMHSSLGHTPESIEVVDGQTRAANGLPNGGASYFSASMEGISGKNTNVPPTTAPTPGFDPSLLEFLDPTAAAQLAANLGSNPSSINPGNPLNLDPNAMNMNEASFADLLANAIGSSRNSPTGYQWSEYELFKKDCTDVRLKPRQRRARPWPPS